MKEGYLQAKIAELNDKIKILDQNIGMENSKIELLEERLGNLKQLIKKLKNLEDFKEQMSKDIKNENEKIISNHIQQLTYKISHSVESILKNKSKEMNETLKYLKDHRDDVEKQLETLSQLIYHINYLKEHNELLMMKLVNKMIISDREVEEMKRRSAKKAKNIN